MAAVLTLAVLLSAAHAQEEEAVPCVVVAEFANKSGESALDWIGHGLRSDLTRRLLRVKGLVVLGTREFGHARNELGLVKADLSEPGEAAKVGKALGAHKVLVGHYAKAPTGVKVALRMVDVNSGKAVGPELSRTGPPISITAGLALEVIGQLGIKMDDASAVTKNLTSNSDAYENYCKGLGYKESEETYEKAIEHFIKAAEQDREYAAPHFQLGWLFTVTGPAMYRSAVKEYRKAISLYPEYAESYNNLGVIHARLEQHQSAMKAYRKAIELVPDYVNAHFNLGRLYDMLSQYDKAVAQYRKALKLNPADAIAHNNLAVALLNEDKGDEAMKSYSAALKLMPDLKEAHLGLGLIYDSKGNTDRAVRHYQKFLDLGGYDEEISERLKQLKKEQE